MSYAVNAFLEILLGVAVLVGCLPRTKSATLLLPLASSISCTSCCSRIYMVDCDRFSLRHWNGYVNGIFGFGFVLFSDDVFWGETSWSYKEQGCHQ